MAKSSGSPKWLKKAHEWNTIPGYDTLYDCGECYFDEVEGLRALAFFETHLRHVKGRWGGELFTLPPWQQAIIVNLFGWMRADKTRRYREAFIYIPRKNGKTTLSAGIALFLLFCDGERGAEIYSAAADREQANLVYEQAKGMVEQDEDLRNNSEIYVKAITAGTGYYRVISSDANTKHGFNPHGAIVDEVHAQPNRELIDVLRSGRGARSQPLMVYITTADYARESICNELYSFAKKVRDNSQVKALPPGTGRDFLPVIYEATKEDDWEAEATWAKANPNLGISVSLEYLREECQKAREQPSFQNTFKRLHLNLQTEQDELWMDVTDFDQCYDPELVLNQLQGHECTLGLDLSSTDDITALAVYFYRLKATFEFYWVPQQTIHRRSKRFQLPYDVWMAKGFIEPTADEVVDYDVVRKKINELGKLFNVKAVGVDRWNSQQLQNQLMDDGFDVVPFGQGFGSMNDPSKTYEKLVKGHELRHNSNPVTRWMFTNVAIELDAAGNIKPSKKKSTEKIDGIVAKIIAIGTASVLEPESNPYQHRGVLILGGAQNELHERISKTNEQRGKILGAGNDAPSRQPR